MAKVPVSSGLAKIMYDIRVDPALSYFGEQVSLGLQLEPHFKHWSVDSASSRFTDAASRSAALLSHNRVAFEMDIPGDASGFESRIRRVIRPYLKSPHIKNVLRIGVRGQCFVDKGFRFEELVLIYHDRLFARVPDELQVMSGKLTDVMFNVVLEKPDNLLMHIVSGPVRREEVGKWIKPINYIGEGPEDNLDYPEVAAFLDVDVYRVAALKPGDAEDAISTAARLMVTTVREFSEYLFGEKR